MKVENKGLAFSIFEEVNLLGVEYCHWKSTDHLEASFRGETDFDVLVSKNDAFKFEVVLLNNGFVRARTPDFRTYPCVEDYIYYDPSSGNWYHFHLHYQLPCGDRWVKSFHIPIEKYILENRVYLAEFSMYNIDPLSEYLFFINRMFMKWRRPLRKKSFVKENEYLVGRIDTNCLLDRDHPLFSDDLHSIYKMLTNKDYSIPISRQIAFKNHLRGCRRFNEVDFSIRSLFRYVYRLYVELNRRVFNNKSFGRRQLINGGRIVTFVGMDGSGKTSMLSEAEKTFSKQLNVTTVFLGSGRSGAHFLRRNIFKFMDILPNNALTKNKVGKTGSNNKKPKFFKCLWIYLCLCDREKELKKMAKGLANGSLVLVDRWPQNKITNVADAKKLNEFVLNNSFTGLVARKEQLFFDRLKAFNPDRTLWFDILPDTSIQRKPNELDLEEAVFYKDALQHLYSDYYSNPSKIFADNAYDEVKLEVNRKIWECINGKAI
ncbi:hypothetical protein VCR14J2_270189 [Vibrio coralliirubri]|uniref:hypothetical protein n=1 Tax=Vibrio coralliirubri TaxID=1516159 RepID=UPI00063905E1|nr:hypothetical protein [Vibrio coralliirubri]CDT99985.1 hypothetical protein VCR14J2_270189 [Vibrio coralliirubri]